MNIKFALTLSFILCTLFSWADEGMWLPNLVKAYNYSDMQSKGLMITAEDLYSAKNASLNDAIVHFNGGCTGEVVSSKGLLFTNHHCGYSYISKYSTPENDYLKDGFWAMNEKEEIACEGLYVDFVRQIEDVTSQILTSENLSAQNIKANLFLAQKKLKGNSNYLIKIKPFNYGKKYFAFVIERYTDVRMVGAPPSAIGKFGFDTDNWVWPRHTGDFSVFRIYADANNKAAPYNENNKPYKPLKHFEISIEGVNENDFTMVYGFPGTTEQHLTSYAVNQKLKTVNPARIKIRSNALDVINATMKESTEKKIKFASFQSRVSNYWKKFKGESFGLEKEDAVLMKQQFEQDLQDKINNTPALKTKYENLLPKLKNAYTNIEKYEKAYSYYIELFFSGPTYIRSIRGLNGLVDKYEKTDSLNEEVFNTEVDRYKSIYADNGAYENHYRNILIKTFQAVIDDLDDEFHPESIQFCSKLDYKTDFDEIINQLFENSYLLNEELAQKLKKASPKKKVKLLKKDPAYIFFTDIFTVYFEKISPERTKYNNQIQALMQQYVSAIYEAYPNQKNWYDANGTLRVSYGKVAGSSPRDGMNYKAFTTADGIMEKYIPNDREFDVPNKLKELIKNKDYGKYGTDSTLTVCFTGTNHTTGGNSGSPVLNGKGQLIGINFDRSWESTMSDVMFSDNLCRNITVDIRYVLFVIDKYAGASHLIKEMDLVEKKDPMKVKRELLIREIDILTTIISQNPTQADLYFKRGKANYELGNLPNSLADYNKAVELNPLKEYIKKRDFIKMVIEQINSIKE